MTDKWLLIENKGEIDINALILMGGSTKRDSTTAIGFFGSGWKYTIALMLKKSIGFRIYSGLQEISIGTKQVNFRDKQFEQILINGQETSLTTDMGPSWDSWMAVRETVSNAIDEGDSNIISSTEDINAKEGYTRIYISHHQDIKDVIAEWDQYFSFDRLDAIVDNTAGKIYPNITGERESQLFYRKGIRCYTSKRRTLYNYDLPGFKINESRVIEDTYDVRHMIGKFLSNWANKQVAKNILQKFTEEMSYYESDLEWYYYGNLTLNPEWREAIGDRVIINNDVSGNYLDIISTQKNYRVSKEMAKAIKKSFPEVPVYGIGDDGDDDGGYRIQEQTPKVQYMLKKAAEFCKDTQYAVNHPIEVVLFDKAEVLGRASNNKILLSAKLFDMGMKELVMTIMEEETHLTTSYEDETRALQNYLFKMWLTEKEERFGIFL